MTVVIGSVAVTVLIAVWGASPGAGKTTLCTGLSARLADAGARVDHFSEEEILTRPQFAAVAREFQATGAVELPTLLSATRQLVDATLARGDDVVIADALVPFVPTLLAMGHGDQAIDAFFAELTAILAPVAPVLVYLDGSTEIGLSRAAEREGSQMPLKQRRRTPRAKRDRGPVVEHEAQREACWLPPRLSNRRSWGG